MGRTEERRSLAKRLVQGVALPLALQAAVSWLFVWLGRRYGWDVAAPILVSFVSIGSFGYAAVTKAQNAITRILIAFLYFPIMFLICLYVAVFAARSVGMDVNF